MAERVFAMPDLGEGLEEGEIVAWLVARRRRGRAEPAARRGGDGEGHGRDPVAVRRDGDDVARVGGDAVPGRLGVGDVRRCRRRTRRPRPDVATSPAKAPATPAVRKLAKERGIDLATITGTGPGGRITVEDLNAASGWDSDVAGVEPITPVRREIAKRLDGGRRRSRR